MILALRIVALVFALIWAIPLFAIVDLSTALVWREGWEETLALEASWGALFTFFMVTDPKTTVRSTSTGNRKRSRTTAIRTS